MAAPENYKVRGGTKDSGRDYEFKVAALMSLRSAGQDVDDMWLAMNVESCGDFDDLILCRTAGGSSNTYIMQLKHQDNPKNIVRDQLLSDKGNYSLKKYESSLCEMHSKINSSEGKKCGVLNYLRQNSEVVPILFTNNGITNYPFLEAAESANVSFLNTGSLFKFDYKALGYTIQTNVRGYFENMCLFTHQAGITDINNLIEIAVKALTNPLEVSHENLNKIAHKYVTFIKEWGTGLLGGHYPLTKTQVQRKLAELLLEPYMSKFYEAHRMLNNKFRTKIWGEIMEEQDATIIDSDNAVTQFLLEYVIHTTTKCDKTRRCEQGYRKLMMRSVSVHEKCTFINDYEYLWKSKKMPLILECGNKRNYETVISILRTFKDMFKVIILKDSTIMGNGFGSLKVFTAMNDLSSDKIHNILQVDVKLQGRPGAKLMALLNNKNEHLNLVTSKDIIHMLSNNFNIGNILNKLPQFFVDRSVPKILLQPKILQVTTKDAFFINCKSFKKFQWFVQKHRIHLQDSHVQEYSSKADCLSDGCSIIILTDDTCVDLNALEKPPKKSMHQLILHDSQELEWVSSLGSTETVRIFREISERTSLKPTTVNNVEKLYSNLIKLVSAGPGMGKSVLMDYIALQTPTSTWVLNVHLKDYLDYYHSEKFRSSVAEDHLRYFNDCVLKSCGCSTSLAKVVFRELLISKRVLLLLDGFDEIAVGFKSEVTKLVLTFYKHGFSMWLTTRPVMREHTEDIFDTLSITLNPFSRQDQFNYLKKYYGSLTRDHVLKKAELIDEFVSQLLDITARNLNDWNDTFIGIPLHTKLLASVFRKKCLNYTDTGNFTLNKNFNLISLYEAFVKEKIRIFHAKYGNFFGDACSQYEKYQQFLALRTLFGKDDFEGITIKDKLHRFIDVMTLKLAQTDSVVVPIDELDITFAHRTYAEYLAARWLADNFLHVENRSTSQYLIRKLFEPAYCNVKGLFDKILAKNCDLHCIILNSNYQTGQVKDAIERYPNILDITDKGGRSGLHLMATRGVHHPIPISSDLKFLKNNINVTHEICIPEALFTTVNNRDKIFDYTPLDYAIISGCLGVVDAICARSEGLIVNILEDHLSSYLYYCCMFGYNSFLEAILKQSEDTSILKKAIDTDLQGYETPLHCATLKRRSTIVDLLLSYGADANKKDFNGRTPLHIAADNGSDDIALLLLSHGAHIDEKDSVCFTPLHRAALKGHGDIVALLLSSCSSNENETCYENCSYTTKSNKVYVNDTDKDKNTALHFSAMNGCTTIVGLLVSNGADVNLTNSRGYTALHLAACNGYTSTVSVLLSNVTANVNTISRNPASAQALYLAADSQVYEDALDSSSLGSTALHEAAKGGYAIIVCLLIYKGANVNLTNSRGFTALHEASRGGHKEIISVLLGSGADVNLKNGRGGTALHEAARSGHLGVVSMLMPKISDVNERDIGGYTALHEAAWRGHSEVVLMLLSNKASDVNARSKRSTTPLYMAARHGQPNVVSLLLSKSAQVNVPSNMGITALHKAAQGGYKNIVSMLLSHAANINLADSQGRTPLFVAYKAGQTHVVSFLLAKNAHTEKVNNHGMTVLHEACSYGDRVAVSELLLYKARVNVKDSVGKAALHHAVSGGKLTIIEELLRHGADVNVKDFDSNTPLDLARKLNYSEVAEYLQRLPDMAICDNQLSINS